MQLLTQVQPTPAPLDRHFPKRSKPKIAFSIAQDQAGRQHGANGGVPAELCLCGVLAGGVLWDLCVPHEELAGHHHTTVLGGLLCCSQHLTDLLHRSLDQPGDELLETRVELSLAEEFLTSTH